MRMRRRGKQTYDVEVVHLVGDLLSLVGASLGRVACALGGSGKGKWVGDACRRCAGCLLRCLGSGRGVVLGHSHCIHIGRVNLLMTWVLPSHVYSSCFY